MHNGALAVPTGQVSMVVQDGTPQGIRAHAGGCNQRGGQTAGANATRPNRPGVERRPSTAVWKAVTVPLQSPAKQAELPHSSCSTRPQSHQLPMDGWMEGFCVDLPWPSSMWTETTTSIQGSAVSSSAFGLKLPGASCMLHRKYCSTFQRAPL